MYLNPSVKLEHGAFSAFGKLPDVFFVQVTVDLAGPRNTFSVKGPATDPAGKAVNAPKILKSAWAESPGWMQEIHSLIIWIWRMDGPLSPKFLAPV